MQGGGIAFLQAMENPYITSQIAGCHFTDLHPTPLRR